MNNPVTIRSLNPIGQGTFDEPDLAPCRAGRPRRHSLMPRTGRPDLPLPGRPTIPLSVRDVTTTPLSGGAPDHGAVKNLAGGSDVTLMRSYAQGGVSSTICGTLREPRPALTGWAMNCTKSAGYQLTSGCDLARSQPQFRGHMVGVRQLVGAVGLVAMAGLAGCTPDSNVTFENNTNSRVVIYAVDPDGARQRVAPIDPNENLSTYLPMSGSCSAHGYQFVDGAGALIKSVGPRRS